MRLYNPTIEQIKAKYNGENYYIDSFRSISVSNETGAWIMEREEFKGLVDITVMSSDKDPKIFVARKIIEGNKKYIDLKNHVLEQFIELDNSIKRENQFGTVLNRKEVRAVREQIKGAEEIIKQTQLKYKISPDAEEIENKSKMLLSSIDTLVAEFEADKEGQRKQRDFERDQDVLLNQVMGDVSSMKIVGAKHGSNVAGA